MSAEIGPSGVRDRARDFPSAYYAAIRLIDGFSDVTGKLIALSGRSEQVEVVVVAAQLDEGL